MELGMDKGVYMVCVLSELLILFSNDMKSLARVARSLNSACEIRKARQTFFFNSWIDCLNNVGVSHLVKG